MGPPTRPRPITPVLDISEGPQILPDFPEGPPDPSQSLPRVPQTVPPLTDSSWTFSRFPRPSRTSTNGPPILLNLPEGPPKSPGPPH